MAPEKHEAFAAAVGVDYKRARITIFLLTSVALGFIGGFYAAQYRGVAYSIFDFQTVLLGLGRGSGARSIAGMRPYDPPWCRPLLGVRRSVTHAACTELGLSSWQDPHNADRRFTRTRLRHEVLPLMEEVLGGGVAEALARTATALREDTELFDALIAQAMTSSATTEGLDIRALAALPDSVRRGVIRSWLLAGGAIGLTDKQIRGVDRLITAWRGQGGVAVGSTLRNQRLVAGRSGGLLTLRPEPI